MVNLPHVLHILPLALTLSSDDPGDRFRTLE